MHTVPLDFLIMADVKKLKSMMWIHFDIWQNQYNIVKLKKKRYKGKEEKNAGSRKGIRRKQKKKKREKNRRLVYLCWGSSLIKDFNAFLLPTKAQQVKVMKWPNK